MDMCVYLSITVYISSHSVMIVDFPFMIVYFP